MQTKYIKMPEHNSHRNLLRIIGMIIAVGLLLWLVNLMFIGQYKVRTDNVEPEERWSPKMKEKWAYPEGIFDKVEDGGNIDIITKKPQESIVYQLCEELTQTPDAVLDAAVEMSVDYKKLMSEPAGYRGKIISVAGKIIKSPSRLPVNGENRIELDSLYDFQIKDFEGNVYSVLSIQPVSEAEEKEDFVAAVGVFYKVLPVDEEGKVSVPLIITPHVRSKTQVSQSLLSRVIVDAVGPSIGIKMPDLLNYAVYKQPEIVFEEDPNIFDDVSDNYYLVRQELGDSNEGLTPAAKTETIENASVLDAIPLYYLVKKSIVTPADKISAEVDESITYDELIYNSEHHRGKAVRLKGRLEQNKKIIMGSSEDNDTGMSVIDRADIANAERQIFLFYCTDKDVMEKIKVRSGVVVEGYFLKNIGLRDRSKGQYIRWYPVIIGKSIKLQNIVEERTSTETLLIVFGVLSVITLAGIYIALRSWHKQSKLKPAKRRPAARDKRVTEPEQQSGNEESPPEPNGHDKPAKDEHDEKL